MEKSRRYSLHRALSGSEIKMITEWFKRENSHDFHVIITTIQGPVWQDFRLLIFFNITKFACVRIVISVM